MKLKTEFTIFDIVVFFSVVFIGADRIGINIGVNLRFVQLFILLSFFGIMLHKSIQLFAPVLFFAIVTLISALLSFSMSRGIIYYSFIFFNAFITYVVYSYYVYYRGLNCFIRLYRLSMYLQFALIILQTILGLSGRNLFGLSNSGYWHGFLRIPLWFYEPSYLATYLIFWFGFSLSMLIFENETSYIKDVVFSCISIVFSTSTAGYLGLMICIMIVYFIALLEKRISYKSIALIPIIVTIFVFFSRTELYNVFVRRISYQGIKIASGDRITRWKETWEVFKNNWVLGVGPGNYGIYLGKTNEYVPTNVSLELLSTLGIIGFFSYYYLHLKLILNCIHFYHEKRDGVVHSILIGFVTFLIILQANQNYLRLYHWMFLGVMGGINKVYAFNEVKDNE